LQCGESGDPIQSTLKAKAGQGRTNEQTPFY
jgi:hypothetical protein